MRRAPALDHLQPPARGDQTRVYRVDAVLGERLQRSLDGIGDQKVDVVLRQLALEVQLDRADAAAEELSVQRCQPFGQVGERPQVDELFGWHCWGVHRETRKLARENRGHLLGNVKGDRGLRLDRRGPDVRRRDEVGQRQQRVVAGRFGLKDVGGRRCETPSAECF